MKAWTTTLVVGAAVLTACGDDQPDSAATSGVRPVAASTATSLAATATSLPPTSGSSGPATDPGDFDAPVIGTAQSWDDVEFCDVIPTDDRSLNEADFGNPAGPAEPLGGAPAAEPACLLQGVNVGEISFAVTTRDQLPERATERASTDGTWSLLEGNTSYVYCNEDEAIDDPACALFVAVDEQHWLTVFVFMPTNDLDDLAEMTRAVTTIALTNLPDG